MPKIILPVPETLESITRPVVFDIVRQIFDETKISPSTMIFFPGDLEKGMQPGSSIGKQGEVNITPFNERISVTVEENYEVEKLISTSIHRAENLHIFRDDRIETSIKPVYSSTDVVINFTYRAVDKVSATRWRDNIRTRLSMGRDVRLHDITYHYLIPDEFIVILKELHRMRENVDPYNEAYDVYFKANATQRASWISNMSGTQGAWGISETQSRIQGYFDISDSVPELGSREGDGDTWTVGFSYKFKYDKPIVCAMNYPLVIHNQLLDQKYRPDGSVDTLEAHQRSYSLSTLMLSAFEKNKGSYDVPQGIAIPDFDEFIPLDIVNSTIRVFNALITIDPDNPELLLSLKELGDFELDPVIIRFITNEGNFVVKDRSSVIVISLYENINLCKSTDLRIDSDLNIYSTRPLSLRNYYHIRLSLYSDLLALAPEALDRLRNDGEALQFILDAIEPNLKYVGRDSEGNLIDSSDNSIGDLGLIPDIIGDNYITRASLARAIGYIDRVRNTKGDNQIRQTNNVMTLFVTTTGNQNADS